MDRRQDGVAAAQRSLHPALPQGEGNAPGGGDAAGVPRHGQVPLIAARRRCLSARPGQRMMRRHATRDPRAVASARSALLSPGSAAPLGATRPPPEPARRS